MYKPTRVYAHVTCVSIVLLLFFDQNYPLNHLWSYGLIHGSLRYITTQSGQKVHTMLLSLLRKIYMLINNSIKNTHCVFILEIENKTYFYRYGGEVHERKKTFDTWSVQRVLCYLIDLQCLLTTEENQSY